MPRGFISFDVIVAVCWKSSQSSEMAKRPRNALRMVDLFLWTYSFGPTIFGEMDILP